MKKSHNKPARGSAKEAKAIQQKKLTKGRFLVVGYEVLEFIKKEALETWETYAQKKTCQRP